MLIVERHGISLQPNELMCWHWQISVECCYYDVIDDE
jgi:hypothetical protein